MEQVNNKYPNAKAKEIAYRCWCDNNLKSVLVIDLEKIAEYNKIPVTWCTNCGSLSIFNCDVDYNPEVTCYCGKCGSSSVNTGNIKEWLQIENKQNI